MENERKDPWTEMVPLVVWLIETLTTCIVSNITSPPIEHSIENIPRPFTALMLFELVIDIFPAINMYACIKQKNEISHKKSSKCKNKQ
jgi:Ca2+/H+ antiporter